MPFAPLAIANRFLAEHGAESGGISHMKLQKLVFHPNRWWLASHDEPLTTEAPQVWKFCPVFNSRYSALAPFGMQPIDSPRRTVPIGTAPIVPMIRTKWGNCWSGLGNATVDVQPASFLLWRTYPKFNHSSAKIVLGNFCYYKITFLRLYDDNHPAGIIKACISRDGQ